MLEKLGKKALIAHIGIGIVLCCILSLAIAPMLRAEPQNVPFAIVNLDKGLPLPATATSAKPWQTTSSQANPRWAEIPTTKANRTTHFPTPFLGRSFPAKKSCRKHWPTTNTTAASLSPRTSPHSR